MPHVWFQCCYETGYFEKICLKLYQVPGTFVLHFRIVPINYLSPHARRGGGRGKPRGWPSHSPRSSIRTHASQIPHNSWTLHPVLAWRLGSRLLDVCSSAQLIATVLVGVLSVLPSTCNMSLRTYVEPASFTHTRAIIGQLFLSVRTKLIFPRIAVLPMEILCTYM